MKKHIYIPFLALFFGLAHADTDVTYFNFIQDKNITSMSYSLSGSCYGEGNIIDAVDVKSGYFQSQNPSEPQEKFFVKVKLNLNNSGTCSNNFANQFPADDGYTYKIFPNFKSADSYKIFFKKPHDLKDYTLYPTTFYFSITGTFIINTVDGNSYSIPLTLVEGQTNIKKSKHTNMMWIASENGSFTSTSDYYKYTYSQGLTVMAGNNQYFCFMPGDDTQTIKVEEGECGDISYNYPHS